jgi:hypothetical protein
MKNKIVLLKDGKTKCRILDAIIHNGDTKYLVIDYKTKGILTIFPQDIYDIYGTSVATGYEEMHSIKDTILKMGL